MLKKITKMNTYPSAKKSIRINPDFDLLSCFDTLLQQFPTKPTIQWVETRQDNHTNNDISPLPIVVLGQLGIVFSDAAPRLLTGKFSHAWVYRKHSKQHKAWTQKY